MLQHSIISGDCLDVMKTFPENHFSAVVTDPPYGLQFMGKDWDGVVPSTEYWKEALRVTKPGGHILAFGGTRTYHRLACAIEDAGWEIRDCILYWGYGSGFPKSHNFGCKCRGDAVPYNHDKVSLSISKNMQSLLPDISLQQSLPSGSKCDVLQDMCRKSNNGEAPSFVERTAKMQLVQQNLRTEAPLRVEQTENLQLHMSRQSEAISSRLDGPHEGNCLEREGEEATREGTQRGNEPCMEGRSNLQAEQGQLHRPQICSLPPGVCTDGQEGRLHHGASPGNDEAPQSSLDKDGSSPSQGSQHPQQQYRKSRTVSGQSHPQNSGMGTCEKCGGLLAFKGYGSSLKPAHEPILLGMKPLDGTFLQNAEKWGVAGLNIDASRVVGKANATIQGQSKNQGNIYGNDQRRLKEFKPHAKGRWPANLILDEEAGQLLDEMTGTLSPGHAPKKSKANPFGGTNDSPREEIKYDSGGASRFFYCPKASSTERGEANNHPTVKPLALMRYLITLISPPKDALILDPFTGSGTTILAAKQLGISAIGIEKSDEYAAIAKARIASHDC